MLWMMSGMNGTLVYMEIDNSTGGIIVTCDIRGV
jgi:hypothetical protein